MSIDKAEVSNASSFDSASLETWNRHPAHLELDLADYKKIERKARLKMDIQVVPLCLVLYLLSFLDRTNISQAVIDGGPDDPGLMTTLGMSSNDYSIALTILYPTYIVFEIPLTLLVKRFGARYWIPTLVIMWGIVETLQGLVTSKTGLYINRIFLGAAEGGILPAISTYLTFLYTPREQQFRQAFFFTGASLSGAFSGLLAAAIRNMAGIGNQHGWQWIFYLEGIFTVLFGILCLFLLPNNAESCMLLTEDERHVLKHRMATPTETYVEREELNEKLRQLQEEKEEPIYIDSPWYRDFFRTFKDPIIMILCAVSFCASLPLSSIAYFSPTIVKQMGDYSPIQAMLMSCPPFAASFAYSLVISVVSDRLRNRYLSTMIGFGLCVIGLSVVMGCEYGPHRYAGIVLLTCGSYSTPPALFTWIANNSAGYYKRATGLALSVIYTQFAGLTSAWLFKTNEEAPKFTRGVATNLSISVLAMLMVTAAWFLVITERKRREQGKRDYRVLDLYKTKHWTKEKMREYLGDDHPEYILEA